MNEFESKIDTWLLAVLLIAILASICAAIFVGFHGGMWVISLCILVVGAALPVWLLASTRYSVANEQLSIKSGPFSWVIPVASINSVQDSRNPVSSPALSLDRMRIDYGNGKFILVSPADKKSFRAAIGHPHK